MRVAEAVSLHLDSAGSQVWNHHLQRAKTRAKSSVSGVTSMNQSISRLMNVESSLKIIRGLGCEYWSSSGLVGSGVQGRKGTGEPKNPVLPFPCSPGAPEEPRSFAVLEHDMNMFKRWYGVGSWACSARRTPCTRYFTQHDFLVSESSSLPNISRVLLSKRVSYAWMELPYDSQDTKRHMKWSWHALNNVTTPENPGQRAGNVRWLQSLMPATLREAHWNRNLRRWDKVWMWPHTSGHLAKNEFNVSGIVKSNLKCCSKISN